MHNDIVGQWSGMLGTKLVVWDYIIGILNTVQVYLDHLYKIDRTIYLCIVHYFIFLFIRTRVYPHNLRQHQFLTIFFYSMFVDSRLIIKSVIYWLIKGYLFLSLAEVFCGYFLFHLKSLLIILFLLYNTF